MKREKKKRIRKQIGKSVFLMLGTAGVMLIFMLLFSYASYPFKVAAAIDTSKGELPEENKAYEKWLKKNESEFNREFKGYAGIHNEESYKKVDLFTCADLDQDGIAELIVSHPAGGKWDMVYVYTYDKKKGKVVQIKGVNGKKGETAAVELYTEMGGWHKWYICKKNHLHSVTYIDIVSQYYEQIYIISKGKLKLYATEGKSNGYGNEGPEEHSYTLKGKETTAKKYTSFRKKCGSDKEPEDYVYPIWNTKENRKIYLK